MSEIERPPSPASSLSDKLLANREGFLRFLERKVGDRALAEDLLQDAFARLGRLSDLRDEAAAVAWFYRVLRNAVIDQARRSAARTRGLAALAEELSDVSTEAPDEASKTCRCVGKAKDTLKPEYREALERIEVDGLPVKELAEQAGISPQNAAVRVFRAREALRRAVHRSCGSCAKEGCVDCTCAD